jgi:HAD superfamily hydrolase (TIGR01490 family)
MDRRGLAENNQRRFAVFDIDGTLIRWQMYHAVTDSLAKSGHISDKDYQIIRDARMLWKKRTGVDSFKEYEHLLVATYEQMLNNISYDNFLDATTTVFDEYKDQVYTYTRELISKLKSKNYLLFAVSGSQTEIVSKIAKHWGFDDYTGTVYEVSNGRFTGKVMSHLGQKHKVLNELATKHGAVFEGSVAVGDSEGDVSMLEAVENPIAFNPTKKLFLYAKEKGWKIVVERKNMVYELEPTKGKYFLK